MMQWLSTLLRGTTATTTADTVPPITNEIELTDPAEKEAAYAANADARARVRRLEETAEVLTLRATEQRGS